MQLLDYIHTTSTLLSKDAHAEHTIEALKKYLKRRGYFKLYPTILKGVQRELLELTNRMSTRVTVARESDLKKFEAEIGVTLAKHGLEKKYKTVIDPTIIGGYIIKGYHTKIDLSHKTTLFKKYQSLKHSI